MSLNEETIGRLGLDENATAALMRVLQIESPAAAAQQARTQQILNAPLLDTFTPDPKAFQIVYRDDAPLPEGEMFSVMLVGLTLEDPATGEIARMNLLIGQNFIPERFVESLEAIKDVRKLVGFGALTISPPGLHLDLATLPKSQITRMTFVAMYYTSNEHAVNALAPHLPASQGKIELLAHMAKKAALAVPRVAAAGAVAVPSPTSAPGGLAVSFGARPDVSSVA